MMSSWRKDMTNEDNFYKLLARCKPRKMTW
jgi:hypothetical protein